MPSVIIPASPNWYCSKVTDSNKRNLLVYAARHDVYIFGYEEFPPKFLGVCVEHREKVTALTLCNHDEYDTLCCSGSEDGVVKLWDTTDKALKLENHVHSHKVTAICWSNQQKDLIISGDDHGTLGVWQFEENRQAAHRLEKAGIQCLAVAPYSPGLVAVGLKTGQLLLVDVKKGGHVVSSLKGHDEEIYSLAWCPVPGEDFKPAPKSEADITDLESFGVDDSWRKKPKEVPSSKIKGFGEEGWLLASGSKDKTIRIWSTSRGRQLLLMKLPSPGRRERGDEGGRGKAWLTLCWLQHDSCRIISSSQSGDILVWDITKVGKEKMSVLNSAGKGHTRFAFNICPLGGDTRTVCTISMDRQIIFWDVDLRYQLGVLPSLGGYVYVAKVSPFDHGRLALGVGDAMIRLWNINSPVPGSTEMTQLWQGIRAKVTALCWHPAKEGILAYGTDDGRVGVYNTLSNKPPQISTTYHRRTVYVVSWGPPSAAWGEGESSGYHVYSCGDGNILEHRPHKLDSEAAQLTTLITRTNPDYRSGGKVPTRSAISWNPDHTAIAIGNDDGTVEVYMGGEFRLVAIVQTHHKLVNVVAWHPHITMATPNNSPYKHYLAIASNESYISVVDLSSLFDESGPSSRLHVTDCWRKLEGHSHRVTGLDWSPHTDEHLVSVSYDGKALVWNVVNGSVLACNQGHIGRLLCCQWSGLDPREVITGGDDFSAHIWSIDDHPLQPGQLEPKKKKKKGKADKCKPKDGDSASGQQTGGACQLDSGHLDSGQSTPRVVSVMGMTTEDSEDIEKLLERKRRELLAKGAVDQPGLNIKQNSKVTEDGDRSRSPEPVAREQPSVGRETQGQAFVVEPTSGTSKKGDKFDNRRKKKARSFFPELSLKENRGKQQMLDDLVTLATLIYDGQEAVGDVDVTHLGLFLDRRAVYAALEVEAEYHRNHDNMDYFYQLEVWKGNISGALRVARQRDELSDWLVAMAPMASFDTWTSVCEDYAIQLESDGQYHKAASYFLACSKVYEAIRLFKRHKLFKEAIALAKVRLSPLDPALEELYTLWAQQLTKDGNYEQAAKCHLAMKQVQDAAKLLARRYDQSSLRTAAHISMIGNDRQHGLMYTQRVVTQHLTQNEWGEVYSFLNSKKDLQVYLATSSLHEMLCEELTTLDILGLDPAVFTTLDQRNSSKTMLPDFILDPSEVDSMSPWQMHLIEGHTFPHHVLRIWYSRFDVAMDTTSIEDMYKTLCLLHAGRQAQAEQNLVLIQVCTDLTLCMLSLMMSETPTAMSHLLQAVGSLHEAGHLHIMQGVLRLFLPQGPKYILKLQQEVTAMRVMISMDTQTHVDGASKVHTIKRYLSKHKDESVINNSSLRCRELDCLRAYYYVTILTFLRESCYSGDLTASDFCQEQNPSGLQPIEKFKDKSCVNVTEGNEALLETDGKVSQSKSENSITDSIDSCITAQSLETNENTMKSSEEKANPVESASEKIDCDTKVEASNHANEKVDTENTASNEKSPTPTSSCGVKSKESSPSALPDKTSSLKKHSRCQNIPVLNVNHYSINVSRLSRLAQGVLWDLQAKRFALTETLGYIHKAISQLLLSKHSQSTTTGNESEMGASEAQPDNSDMQNPSSESNTNSKPAGSKSNRHSENSASTADSSQTARTSEPMAAGGDEGAVAMATELATKSETPTSAGPMGGLSMDTEIHICEHHEHHAQNLHVEGHLCHSVLSHHFDQMLNIHVPHVGEVSVGEVLSETENELKCSFFEVCSSCELLQKSRKILFEDEPHCHTRGEYKDMTNMTNPAKYINVPDEWYGMPVDQKYFKRYITMAILKDEQEYVMGELKRGPDSTQAPFPNPLESVKTLLDVASHSSHISRVERQQFAQKVISWVLNFACTTQQKQTFLTLLQSHLEN